MQPALDDGDVRIWLGDAIEALRQMPAGSAQTCITSPPFWGLRDYGTGRWDGGRDDCDHVAPAKGGDGSTTGLTRQGASTFGDERRGGTYRDVCGKCGARRVDQQIGLEGTPDEWCARLVDVFRGVRRVLRDDGTLWLEVGDSYNGSGGFAPDAPSNQARERGEGWGTLNPSSRPAREVKLGNRPKRIAGLKPKDLVGAPWLLAFALRNDGWYLRSDIVWARPNPMPESVTDRPTKSHSYVFLLTKRPRYFFDSDAIREDAPERVVKMPDGWDTGEGGHGTIHRNGREKGRPANAVVSGRNARSVWNIATEPTPFAHFATFPQELVRRCILAGTSERGACPACGAPWARQVERGETNWQERKANGATRGNLAAEGNVGAGHAGGVHGVGMSHDLNAAPRTLTGWAPTCTCDAGDPVPCTVLDPFMGSGTTALVARSLGRHAIGCELNADYLAIARKRLEQLSLLA
jgi:DNA modification methylase